MQEILSYIVKNLVSNPEAVEIINEKQGKTSVLKVIVDEKDLGSVIGRGGAIANAIRTVVRSTANSHERLVIKFDAKKEEVGE